MMQSLQSAVRIGRTVLVAGITLLIGATGPALAHEGGGEYGGGMMDSGWGMFGGWGVLWLLMLVGIVVLVVTMIGGNERTQNGNQQDRAYEELRKQYARGEFSDEEFEKRRRKLQPTRNIEENLTR